MTSPPSSPLQPGWGEQTPMEQRGAISRIAERDPDLRVSYTLGELDALLCAVEDTADRNAFLRGQIAGQNLAALETKYGSFRASVQAVINAARKVLAQYEPHEIVDAEAELSAALAAYDEPFGSPSRHGPVRG
jgi:hypothetical protein